MKAASALGGIFVARTKQRGQFAIGLAAAMTGLRIFRRLTRASARPVIRFQIKPGEIYEIRGLRRDR